MKKLNLGCGKEILEDYDNLDSVNNPGVMLIQDLNKYPYDIKSYTYDFIRAKFILEHIIDIEKCIGELHRILKIGGKLLIIVPYDSSYSAWACPQHKRAYNLRSFDIFCEKTKQKIITNDYGYNFIFRDIQKKLIFPKGLHFESYIFEPIFNLMKRIYEETMFRVLLPAHAIEIILTK